MDRTAPDYADIYTDTPTDWWKLEVFDPESGETRKDYKFVRVDVKAGWADVWDKEAPVFGDPVPTKRI